MNNNSTNNNTTQIDQSTKNKKIGRLLIVLPIIFFVFCDIVKAIIFASSGTMIVIDENEARAQEAWHVFLGKIDNVFSFLIIFSFLLVIVSIPYGVYYLNKKNNTLGI